jgi:hypothetical protein
MGKLLVTISTWELHAVPENINIRFKDISLEKQRDVFHLRTGTELTVCKGWNSMSIGHVIFAARVQGLLGPNQENVFSGFKLRCSLEYEARSLDMTQAPQIKEEE